MELTGTTRFVLPDGSTVQIGLIEHLFRAWTGQAPPQSYGPKPIVASRGRGVFAEVAIVDLLRADGWEAVWASPFGGLRFFADQPNAQRGNTVALPAAVAAAVERITAQNGTSAGMFDVLAWKGGDLLFVEAKRRGHDRIRETQRKWVRAALQVGFSPHQFAVFEWSLDSGTEAPRRRRPPETPH